jgi:WD40 repeat protein
VEGVTVAARLLPALLLAALSSASSAAAEAPPPAEAKVRTDAYGDPLPEGARYRIGTVRLRHEGQVVDVAWAPDGKTLVSAGLDHTVRLWRMPEGKEIRRLELGSGAASCMALSPDGRVLATAGTARSLYPEDRITAPGGGVRLWDLDTGKELRRLGSAEADVRSIAFAPDGKTVAAGGEKEVRLFDPQSGKERRVLKGDANYFYSLTFAPDGKTLAAAGHGRFHCWDLPTGKELPRPKGGAADSLAFSPDGKTLAALNGDLDTALALWNWPEGTERLRPPIENLDPYTLRFSPDGKLLAVTGLQGDVFLLEASTGKEVRRFKSSTNGTGAFRFAFSPDGSQLAATDLGWVVVVRDLSGGKEPRPRTGLAFRTASFAVAPDGKTLFTSARDGTLDQWDARDGRHLRKLGRWSHAAYELTPSADGKLLIAAEADCLWDVTGGKPRPLPKPENAIALSQDGTVLVLGEENGVLLRDAATGRDIRRLEERKGSNWWSLAWTPDSQTLAGARFYGPLLVWDARTGRRLMRLESRKLCIPFPLTLSPDGRLLAVFWEDGTLRLYETASGQPLRQIDTCSGRGSALAFFGDNRTLAYAEVSADASEGEVRLCDALTGTRLRTLSGRQGPIRNLAFLPEGALVTCGQDDTVLCWGPRLCTAGPLIGRKFPPTA